jgi:predicted nucleotidyltransferase
MDKGELTLRLIIEGLLMTIIYFILSSLNASGFNLFYLIFSLFIAHTINWVFNGNLWALLIFAIPHLENRGTSKTINYLNKIGSRLKIYRCIGGVLIYGSVSRGRWHHKSDVDLRILRKPGLANLIQAYMLTIRERALAAVSMQPIDMFLADGIPFLKKMRSDEIPLILIKCDQRLEVEYPKVPETFLTELHGEK